MAFASCIALLGIYQFVSQVPIPKALQIEVWNTAGSVFCKVVHIEEADKTEHRQPC